VLKFFLAQKFLDALLVHAKVKSGLHRKRRK